jgi:hypothetical protein
MFTGGWPTYQISKKMETTVKYCVNNNKNNGRKKFAVRKLQDNVYEIPWYVF